jgi:ATP-dependent protease ClpP protease subunit
VEQIERDMVRDFFMSAEEAKGYGLIDNVITSRGDLVSPEVIAAQAASKGP